MRAIRTVLYFPSVILFFAVSLYGEDLKISVIVEFGTGKNEDLTVTVNSVAP